MVIALDRDAGDELAAGGISGDPTAARQRPIAEASPESVGESHAIRGLPEEKVRGATAYAPLQPEVTTPAIRHSSRRRRLAEARKKLLNLCSAGDLNDTTLNHATGAST